MPRATRITALPAELADLLHFSDGERFVVEEAADDAHVDPVTYCRLVLLMASGQGGLAEYLERANSVGFELDQRGVTIKAAPKKKARRS